jgi:hypothetical protein
MPDKEEKMRQREKIYASLVVHILSMQIERHKVNHCRHIHFCYL